MEKEPHPEHAQLKARIKQIKEQLSHTTDSQARERLIDELVKIAEQLATMHQEAT
jgi:hypothetical protein